MAKTIKIFLIDGEPNGLKTAELSNWVGQAVVIPRNKLKEIKQRPECNKPAVYFLVGKESEEALLPTAYVGEAENLWNRLSTHDSSKDFWQTAVATGRMTNDGFVVYKDSTATTDISKAVIERNQKIIEKLLLNKYLEKRNDGLYIFVKDYVFNSPSAASDIVLGNSTSGWKKWKTESGKTLEEIYRK